MSKTEHPLEALKHFIPPAAFDEVAQLIHHYKVHLTVTKSRKSVLGDYRHPFLGANHKITVNGSLNQFEFLITLLHELAHLLCFEQYRNRVEAHGKEWKQIYATLLHAFMRPDIFPEDVIAALQKTIINPAATANGEVKLLTVLRTYNAKKNSNAVLMGQIPEGTRFYYGKEQKVFVKMKKRRTRFECKEMQSGLIYSFSALTEVIVVTD